MISWPFILITTGSLAVLFTIAALLGRYLKPQPFEQRRRITLEPTNRLEIDITDELGPAPFVESIHTPIVTEYLCPHCGKPMLPEQKLYHVGLRPIGHSRCVLNPPMPPRAA